VSVHHQLFVRSNAIFILRWYFCTLERLTSVLHNNDRAMTGNLDSKIISIDSYLQVEMAGKFSTFMYLFLCTSSMTIG
jgi:hypothetical protein